METKPLRKQVVDGRQIVRKYGRDPDDLIHDYEDHIRKMVLPSTMSHGCFFRETVRDIERKSDFSFFLIGFLLLELANSFMRIYGLEEISETGPSQPATE